MLLISLVPVVVAPCKLRNDELTLRGLRSRRQERHRFIARLRRDATPPRKCSRLGVGPSWNQRTLCRETTQLRYILRPPIAQERIQHGPDNLVRIAFKRPFSDGTVAVDMDPLSLLLRLCAAVPAPRFSPVEDREARHTVRYAGVLAARSKVRPHIVRAHDDRDDDHDDVAGDDERVKRGSRYWPWAELMARTFKVDVEKCPRCGERMKLVALVQEKNSVERFLRRLGELFDVPERASARAPPYYRSAIVRRLTSGDIAAA